jgi:hypothetical protein
MVYIKESDVTVEDSGDHIGDGPTDKRKFVTLTSVADDFHVTHDEAEILLRGLLRWKLETAGPSITNAFFHQLISDYLEKERGR